MLTGEIKNQIDRIWDAVWSGRILAVLARLEGEIQHGISELEDLLK